MTMAGIEAVGGVGPELKLNVTSLPSSSGFEVLTIPMPGVNDVGEVIMLFAWEAGGAEVCEIITGDPDEMKDIS